MKKKNIKIKPSLIFIDPVHFLAFGFGSGLSPKAPGTAGSVVGLVLYILLAGLSDVVFISITLFLFLAGVWICGESSKKLGVHDHGGIVWDEIVGMLIALFHAPLSIPWLVCGFILFRFFDIVKPWPIKWLDKKVKGGFGIMIDDVLAGIFAFIVLQLLILLMGNAV